MTERGVEVQFVHGYGQSHGGIEHDFGDHGGRQHEPDDPPYGGKPPCGHGPYGHEHLQRGYVKEQHLYDL
jgi:hypothetical protein